MRSMSSQAIGPQKNKVWENSVHSVTHDCTSSRAGHGVGKENLHIRQALNETGLYGVGAHVIDELV